MSRPPDGGPGTAASVRAANRTLDEELRAVMSRVTDAQLHLRTAPDEWTVAEQLGHISEFPVCFATQLRAWRRDRSVPVGRTHESADRLAGVARAAGRDAGALHGEATAALAELEEALAELTDRDLASPTRNVKYGDEPLSAFLERYVIGHKRAHAAQLRATLGR